MTSPTIKGFSVSYFLYTLCTLLCTISFVTDRHRSWRRCGNRRSGNWCHLCLSRLWCCDDHHWNQAQQSNASCTAWNERRKMRAIVTRSSGLNYRIGSVIGLFYRPLRNRCVYCSIALKPQSQLLKNNHFLRVKSSVSGCLPNQIREANHKIPIGLLTNQTATQRPAVSSLGACPTSALWSVAIARESIVTCADVWQPLTIALVQCSLI